MKDAAAAFQRVLQLGRVDDLAVVHCGKAADAAPRHQRLDVLDFAAAGRTVAHMPDRAAAGQGFQITRTECFGEQPLSLMATDALSIRRGDAGALLPAVLQRMQAEIGQLCCLRMLKNPKHPALLVQFLHASFLHPYLLLAFIRNAEKACRIPAAIFRRRDAVKTLILSAGRYPSGGIIPHPAGQRHFLRRCGFSPPGPRCTRRFCRPRYVRYKAPFSRPRSRRPPGYG